MNLMKTVFAAIAAASMAGAVRAAAPVVQSVTQTAPTTVEIAVDAAPGDLFVEYARASETYPTVKDRYVADGLIAMWDGEDNQGTGVHQPAATNWVDLTGNHAAMAFKAAPTVNAKSYDVSAGGGCIASAADIAAALNANAATIEIVCNVRTMVDNASLFACVDGDSGNRIAWVRTSTVSGMVGIVAVAEYKSTSFYDPYPKFDTALNTVRSYTFTYSSDACRIHKDGSLTDKSVANKGVSGNTATAAFSVGQRISQNGGFSAAISDMDVYCVRIYDRVLTADEIAANHAQDVARFWGAAPVDLDSPGPEAVMTNLLGTVKTAATSARDFYATNGLIAMWDGEDNQGTGAHVAGATTWVDLTGNHEDMAFATAPTVNAMNYDVSAGGGRITDAADIGRALNAEACTIEIVCNPVLLVNDGTLFACVDGSNPKHRTAWARSGDTTGIRGVIASMEYKAGDYAYPPYQCYDQTFASVRAYTFTYSADKCRIYRNGSSEVAASGGNEGVNCDPSTTWFSIGQRISQGGQSAAIANMKVYCVRVYDRVLTADEIAANHAADVARFWGDSTSLPLGSTPVRLADGSFATTAGIPLTGLRPDVADYSARLITAGATPARSAVFSFSTASEREGSAWFEYLDSNRHPDSSKNLGAAIYLGFVPGSRVPVVKTKYQFLSNTNSRFAFGAYSVSEASGTAAGIFAKDGHNQFRYRVGADSINDDGYADLGAANLTAVHELELNGPNGTFLNGTLLNAAMSGRTDACTVSWALFAREYYPGSGSPYFEFANVRMWYFKLWADNALVRDMVPARRYGRAACMFDRKDDRFFANDGYRDFIPGPMRPAPVLSGVALAGSTLTATLARTGTATSDVFVAYGATYGDAEPSAWDHFERLDAGFAADAASLAVNVAGLAKGSDRYVRFYSYEDGWSDTVFLPDLPSEQPFVLTIR